MTDPLTVKGGAMTRYDAMDIAIGVLSHFATIGQDECGVAASVLGQMQLQLIRHEARRNLRRRAMRKALGGGQCPNF